MKILYDHQIFSIQKYGGVTKYFCELLKNLPKEHQFELAVLFSDNHYLKEDHKIFNTWNVPIADKQFKGKGSMKKVMYFINQCYSKHLISSKKYDLLHPTYYGTYFCSTLKIPYILTVHDLIPFKNELYKKNSLRGHMEKSIKKASRIIAISENTKKDLIEILKISPDKIDVIYHGFNQPNVKNLQNIYGRYILFVGRRAGYKNFKTFAEAISVLLKRERDLKLICVGAPFTKEEIAHFNLFKITRQTIALAASEQFLNSLYLHAKAFVNPSLYEGFGMPILEAFANNCPACLSNKGSLSEIAGNAAVYFNPYCKESMLNAIEKVIYDDEFSKNLIDLGKTRLKNFSWHKTAELTMNTYKKTLA